MGLRKKGVVPPKGYEEENPLEPLDEDEELIALGTEPMEDLDEAVGFEKALKETRTRVERPPAERRRARKRGQGQGQEQGPRRRSRHAKPPRPDSEATRRYLEAFASSTEEDSDEEPETENDGEEDDGLFADNNEDFAAFF
jgi:hypothetical protein